MKQPEILSPGPRRDGGRNIERRDFPGFAEKVWSKW